MSKHEAVRQQLEQELTRLVARSGAITGDLRKPHDRDSQEQAIELENDAVLEGLDELTRAQVGEIRGALGRIANGSYGACATCGRAIDEKRLAALPSTLTCVHCATSPRRPA